MKWGVVAGLVLVAIGLVALPHLRPVLYSAPVAESSPVATAIQPPVVTHVATPLAVKGIYMTACVAGSPKWRAELERMITTTELNSIVIDIKDYTGTISFIAPTLEEGSAGGCHVSDMQNFIMELHKQGVYVIGRVTVFQDPHYARVHPELAIKSKSNGGTWKDYKGLPFIDVGARPYWDHVVAIAKAGYALGFDEINFDYVRYPSDGNLKDMNTTWTVGSSTKAQMVQDFFVYLHDQLRNTGMKTSADLFGLTTLAEDDMGIGQVLTNALPYFDYIDPMVYPSHFASGADGFAKPAEHPYDIIKWSMSSGLAREQALDIKMGIATSTPSKLRPWIQDFDLGAVYNAPEVRAQMQATYDTGLTSWLSWDAGNHYTPGAYTLRSVVSRNE